MLSIVEIILCVIGFSVSEDVEQHNSINTNEHQYIPINTNFQLEFVFWGGTRSQYIVYSIWHIGDIKFKNQKADYLIFYS